jgi:AcrR family transcriptional regulator
VSAPNTEKHTTERRGEIVQAALELLDESGFERLSLRRLAGHLGMHAPGLYWYIDSKQQLIDLLAKAILDEGMSDIATPIDDQTWQDWLVELACTTRRTLLAHRDGARVVAGAYLLNTNALSHVIECSLEVLETAGLDRVTALGGTMTVLRYATGIALDEQASPLRDSPAMSAAQKLAALPPPPIDADRWPRTADALRQVITRNLRDREQLFRWGAILIVRGLAETIRALNIRDVADSPARPYLDSFEP